MENNRMSRDGRRTGPQLPPTRRHPQEERDRLRTAQTGLKMPGSNETAADQARERQRAAQERTRREAEKYAGQREEQREDGRRYMRDSHQKKPSQAVLARKKKIKRLWTILGLEIVCFALLLIGYGVFYINHKLGMMQYDDLDRDDLSINEGVEDNQDAYTTIALFGLDSRDVTTDTGNRSDTILIASINNKTKEVRLVSVYRDTYLEMENPDGNCDGLYTKITHAYAYGGPKAAVATLNKNLDLQITDYVTVNFASLADVVDDLGGITVNVDEDERQSINIWIPETAQIAGSSYSALYETGDVTLDGMQAVTYCRIRNIGAGDIDRAARQREVLGALLDKAKQSDLDTLNTILDDVLGEISTSLSQKEILSLMSHVFEYELTENEGFPMVYHVGTYYDQAAGQDLSIDVAANLENNVQLLHEFFYDVEIDDALQAEATEEGEMSEDGADTDTTAAETTETEAGDDETEVYEPSAEVQRISLEIEENTGVYAPEDLTFRGGF